MSEKPRVNLPSHDFFYTIEQVALILSVPESWLDKNIYFTGRMPDAAHRSKMVAINLAEQDQRPKWRISEREFTRWLARKGYKVIRS